MEQLQALQEEYEKLARSYLASRETVESAHAKKCAPLFERRRKIITGEAEPSAEELGASAEVTEKQVEEEETGAPGKKKGQTKGVPNFWLSVIKKHDTAAEYVQKRDEGCLKYVKDIRIGLPKDAAHGYRLELEFAPNPYFLDRFLVKEVAIETAEDGEGGTKATSFFLKECTHISWKGDEHNLTISIKRSGGGKGRSDKKSQGKKKGKGKRPGEDDGVVQTTTRTKPCASFFNLFSESRNLKGRRGGQAARGGPPAEGEEDEDEGIHGGPPHGEDGDEFEVGGGGDWIPPDHLELLQAFQQEIVPRALEFFLSEAFGRDDERESDDGVADGGEDEEYPSAKPEEEPEAEPEAKNEAVQRRIQALQYLHEQLLGAQRARDEELAKLRTALQQKAAPLRARRVELIVGEKAKKSGKAADLAYPHFWLLALKGCPVTVELIRRRDQPLLEHLADIRVVPVKALDGEGRPALTVEFEFLAGIKEWMHETVLSLTFTFFGEGEGEPIANCRGSGISWVEGMEVTLKEVESRKGGMQLKKCPSFFHLFVDDTRPFAFVGDDTVGLNEEELLSKETELAYALRDSLLTDPVGLYAVAKEWADDGDGDEDDDDDEDDGEADEDEAGDRSDKAALAQKMAQKARRGKKSRKPDDNNEGLVCGLSRGTMLALLLLLILTTPTVLFIEQMLSSFGLSILS